MADKTNVSTGKPKVGGAVFVAPVGTTLPTDATTALDKAFVGLGYVSEDGLKNAGDWEDNAFKAWGGDKVLEEAYRSSDTFSFTLIEVLSADTLKLVYGDSNVTGSLASGITVKANSQSQTEHSLVFDMIMRDGAVKRIVVPSAVVTEVGDITYADSDLVGYETTASASVDASGNSHYEYIKRPATA